MFAFHTHTYTHTRRINLSLNKPSQASLTPSYQIDKVLSLPFSAKKKEKKKAFCQSLSLCLSRSLYQSVTFSQVQGALPFPARRTETPFPSLSLTTPSSFCLSHAVSLSHSTSVVLSVDEPPIWSLADTLSISLSILLL